PGLGPLTELLLEKAGKVLAIEKDARLVQALRDRLGAARGHSCPQQHPIDDRASEQTRLQQSSRLAADMNVRAPVVRMLHDDALAFLQREKRDWSEWKVVSNLPYSIASPILVELARAHRGPQRMVVTLQLEVADRLRARPG